MTLASLFSHLLGWIIDFALFVPVQCLKFAGLLFGTCSDFGLTQIPQMAMLNAVQWVRFAWPILQYFPWAFIWNYLAAVILYILFKYFWNNLPKIISFVLQFWYIVVIFYVVAGILTIFTGDSWKSSSAFEDAFGESPSSTFEGGGFGGGGGGGW